MRRITDHSLEIKIKVDNIQDCNKNGEKIHCDSLKVFLFQMFVFYRVVTYKYLGLIIHVVVISLRSSKYYKVHIPWPRG